jgi:hypothetical protein
MVQCGTSYVINALAESALPGLDELIIERFPNSGK